MAYESPADIIGYGGSAGGGKSQMQIGLAVTRHRRSIIFRREADQVRDLWAKLADVCGTHGRANENLMVWRDLPGDRVVRLAGCKNESDWRKYAGHENDLMGFDEATQFTETQVRTLIAWNRTTLPGQRCRVVLGFNPPTTAEGQWVIDFFAPWLDAKHLDPAEPGELRWFAVLGGKDVECDSGEPFLHQGETITPLSRTFIPARLEDNPYLEATGYRATLQNVPEPLRSQLLYGDFSVGLTDALWQVIPSAWVRAAQARWMPNGRPESPDGRPWPLAQIGVDVAQGGDARTVLARRYGDYVAALQVIPGAETPEPDDAAAFVMAALAEAGGPALVDSDGVGAGCYGIVRAQMPTRVRPYRGSAPTHWTDASRQLTFANTRAAAWWALREALDPGSGRELALPAGRELLAELTAPRWEMKAGKLTVERKPDIMKRLGRSPDTADAVVMACWQDYGAVWDVTQPLAISGRAG